MSDFLFAHSFTDMRPLEFKLHPSASFCNLKLHPRTKRLSNLRYLRTKNTMYWIFFWFWGKDLIETRTYLYLYFWRSTLLHNVENEIKKVKCDKHLKLFIRSWKCSGNEIIIWSRIINENIDQTALIFCFESNIIRSGCRPQIIYNEILSFKD